MEDKYGFGKTILERNAGVLHWGAAWQVQRRQLKVVTHSKIIERVFVEEKREIRKVLLPF